MFNAWFMVIPRTLVGLSYFTLGFAFYTSLAIGILLVVAILPLTYLVFKPNLGKAYKGVTPC